MNANIFNISLSFLFKMQPSAFSVLFWCTGVFAKTENLENRLWISQDHSNQNGRQKSNTYYGQACISCQDRIREMVQNPQSTLKAQSYSI